MKPLQQMLIPLFALLLVGCASSQAPIIKTEDKIVNVAVQVPCKVTLPERPAMPLDSAKPEEDVFTKIKKALAEIELRQSYEEKLEAAAKSCS